MKKEFKLIIIISIIFLFSSICNATTIHGIRHNDVGDTLEETEYDADDYGETGVHEGSASGATLIVAASDNQRKQKADYIDDTQLVCDGTADQVEINNALSALPDDGGKVVVLEGNYVLSDRININKSNTELHFLKGAKFTFAPSTDADFIKAHNLGNIYIHGGEFNGANQVVSAASCAGIIFHLVNDGCIKDMIFNNTWDSGIQVRDCNRVKVFNNRIYNIRNTNLQACGMLIDSHQGESWQQGDIVVMYNNILTGYGEGVDINKPVQNVTFSHNTVRNFPEQGIDAGGARNTIISNNIVRNCGTTTNRQAIICPCSGMVSNNIVEGGITGIGAYEPGCALTIVGNEVYGQDYGIRLHNVSHFCVSGNKCHRANFFGIRLSGTSHYNTVIGNQVFNNSQGNQGVRAGINVEDTSSHNLVTGNSISDNQETITEVLSSNANSGQKNIVIVDIDNQMERLFWVGQFITIADDAPNSESCVIAAIDETTQTITVVDNLTNNYTTANNAYIVGEKTQGRAINEEDTADYNVYKNNMMMGNVTESFNSLIGVHNTYDISAISVEMDLSNAAEDFLVFHAICPCVLVGYQTVWTEAAGDANTCTIRIGEIEDDGTVDDNEYDSYTTAGNETLGQVTYKKYSDLNNETEDIPIGHSITVGHTQKTGGGKVRIVLQIAEMAN